MDALNHYVEVVKDWAELQVKTSQDWFGTMQEVDQFKPELIWGKTIEACRTSVQGTLDAEVAGSEILFEEVVPVKNIPDTAVDMVQHLHGITDDIIKVQQSVADKWFDLLKQVDLPELPSFVEKELPAPKAAKA